MHPSFPLLFSPLKVGHRTLRNRICCSAHAEAMADDGMPTERLVRYYDLKARGGVGFIMCFGSASVHPTSPGRDWNGIELFEDRVIPHLRVFSDAMHRNEVPCVAQITHRGRRGRSIGTFERLYAPSNVREPSHRETPHPLDPRTMKEFIQAFADAAGRLRAGGFDGCEVMASHCHLIDQFWTPNANRRADGYGGDLANRMRFGVEVMRAIRERVGSDFIVGVRMTGDDFLEGGLNNTVCQEIAGRLDELGLLDYFNIVGGSPETSRGEAACVPDMSSPSALYCPLAASIKAVVHVPVIAVGRINDPATAERALAEGQADLCVMTRALLADPELPAKALRGETDAIRPCFGYNEGCIDRIYTGRSVTCVQNAVIGREADWADLPRAAEPKRVAIVGGGPAGLECARVARLRGHDVVLFEKEEELGGQTLIARRAPSRADFDGACRYAAAQCGKLGVDLRLGVAADANMLLSESPDAVVLATGARALRPDLPGLAEAATSAWDVLRGAQVPAGRVLVIDEEYGFQALSTAEFLLDQGREVHIVTSERSIGSFLGATTAPPAFARLFSKGITLHCNLRVVRIAAPRAIARNVWSNREEAFGPYEHFVYAYGGESVCDLEARLEGRVNRLDLIGDCFAPRTLQHAIFEGHRIARDL